MLEIIANPITISVIVMCALCMMKLKVILSLLVSAMDAGLTAGMNPGDIMSTKIPVKFGELLILWVERLILSIVLAGIVALILFCYSVGRKKNAPESPTVAVYGSAIHSGAF